MFSYYGSKCKIAKHYPAPQFTTIIEPFAGAAWYSLQFPKNRVILNDKDKTIYGIWKWLTQEATPESLVSNKDFFLGGDISRMDITQAQKDFIGFCINRGSVSPKNIVQKWSCQVSSRPEWASTVSFQILRAAGLCTQVRHWEIYNKDYRDLPNIEATWFIDPPYFVGGNLYKENKIDYSELAEWCKTRKGQVIVCENSKADWLPFETLISIQGQSSKSVEVIWQSKSEVSDAQ